MKWNLFREVAAHREEINLLHDRIDTLTTELKARPTARQVQCATRQRPVIRSGQLCHGHDLAWVSTSSLSSPFAYLGSPTSTLPTPAPSGHKFQCRKCGLTYVVSAFDSLTEQERAAMDKVLSLGKGKRGRK